MDIPFFKNLSLAKGLALFKPKAASVLGIDLGTSSFKIVQLRRDKEQGVLETYGELASGPYGGAEIGKSVKLVDQKIVEMIGDLLKETNATSKSAVVSIPLRNSFVTKISLPLMSETELAEAITYEARRYIPVPSNEVIIDWMLLPQSIASSDREDEGFAKERRFMDVLLVAIHRELVEKYQSIFKTADLNVLAFEIEVFSQVRSVLGREVAPVLIVDIGAQSTRLTVVDYGIVRLSHNLDRGSQDLTQALSRSLNIDFERAEKLKRETGLSGRPEHKEIVGVIQPLLDYIFSEAERVSTDYHQRNNRAIKRVILAGGGANLKGIVDFSINKFGIESSTANPFSRVTYPAFLEPVLKDLGPTFSNSLGLALRALQD
ncbi:type IV pilus assembly protein PilM [Candidatus Giovannonibacteria bacterium]|nr:type IV pilus assembly protein PilM [Candidatus Giovannonibacteria bacterium]